MLFSRIKNADLSKTTKNGFDRYFKNIPESEVAFLCFYNKTFPKFLCKEKWKYSPRQNSAMVFSKIEYIQYCLFLLMNGYSILPIPLTYLYGLISFIGVTSFSLKPSKSKTKRKTESYKPKTKTDEIIVEKINEKYNIRINKKTNMVHKNDVNLLTHVIYKLERTDENYGKTISQSSFFEKHKTI